MPSKLSSFKSVDITAQFGKELDETVKAMTQRGKGLLAADESTGTIGKRFATINVENTEANRQAYREMLFQVSDKANKFISGVILFEETLFQSTKDGVPFVKLLKDNGIVPGIKVDKGLVPLPGTDEEPIVQGLDGLAERCKKYYEQGARFAKFRSVFNINESSPSELAIRQNCDAQARYAAICQQNGLVPIVEPEVLVMVGDHSIDVSFDVTVRVLSQLYKSLLEHHVVLERTILKPNMVLPGNDCPEKADAKKVAEYTVRALRMTVPAAVPGIMFLSGGQSEEYAAETLNEINKRPELKPWPLSFSYGRALQQSALQGWKGDSNNLEAGQAGYLKRAEACYKATLGEL